MPEPILQTRVAGKTATKILETAISQMGVTEVPLGSNDGPQVREYLASVGLGPGYAWCMAFVYWCAQKGCAAAGVENPLLKTGGVMAQFNGQPRKGTQKLDSQVKAIAPEDVRPGDIFIMQFKGGLGHTGFVGKVSGTDVYTVEGNTDPGGSREGIGVFRKRRKISGIRGFIRVL